MLILKKIYKQIKSRNLLLREHIGLLIVFSLLYYNLSKYSENENDIKKFSNYEQCLYFTVVTHFTIGFGDIAPESSLLRRLCMVHIFSAFLLFYT